MTANRQQKTCSVGVSTTPSRYTSIPRLSCAEASKSRDTSSPSCSHAISASIQLSMSGSGNNLIFCRSDETVRVGEKICAYGSGVGNASYTRTYENGTSAEFNTLLVDVGYTLRKDIDFGESIPSCLEDIVYGSYRVSASSSSSYLLENELTISENSISGRPLQIKAVALTFAANNITDIVGNPVTVKVTTSTTSTKGYDCTIVFYFHLDDSGFTYAGHQSSATSAAEVDYASYVKVG